MLYALYIPACAVLMRIKGGGPSNAPKWFRDLDGGAASSVLFALLCLAVAPWWQAALMGAAWHVGNRPSIGEEIGATGGIRGNWFSDRESWFGSGWFRRVKSDRLWGWLSGCARGGFLGLLLAGASLNPWFIPAGALFPAAYFIGVSIQQVRAGQVRADWHYGEYLYGAIIGAAGSFGIGSGAEPITHVDYPFALPTT